MVPWKDERMQSIWRHFFLGRRWINNQRKSNTVWCNTLHRKIIELIFCARRLLKVTKSRLNIHICQHCGVKTSTVTTSFYYVFNMSLSCKYSTRSFIGNLWRVFLLRNHLKPMEWVAFTNFMILKDYKLFYIWQSEMFISQFSKWVDCFFRYQYLWLYFLSK